MNKFERIDGSGKIRVCMSITKSEAHFINFTSCE